MPTLTEKRGLSSTSFANHETDDVNHALSSLMLESKV